MNNIDNYIKQEDYKRENENEIYTQKSEKEQSIEKTTFNGNSTLDYVKYLLNDSEINNNINYSELRKELDTSTYEGDTFKRKSEIELDDYIYFKEDKYKKALNANEINYNLEDELLTDNADYILKSNIIQLKKELIEEKHKNQVLQEENEKLKLLLKETKMENEEKRTILDNGYIDTHLKLNPEQQITLEKLQELMIQLSKKIEKLKNDNETLKQKVILTNLEKENKTPINTIKLENKYLNDNYFNILTDDECRHVLYYICNHLKIKDFSNIKTNLKNVELTIKAVPQMQNFITEIDDLVWKSKDDDKIHKLSETLIEIKKLIKKSR